MNTKRRTCLKMMAAAVGGVATGVVGTQLVTLVPNRPIRRLRVLTDAEAARVVALAEQIIPADKDPGATDAGVVYYIDKQLSGKFKKHLPTYRQGLVCLDETAQKMFGAPFLSIEFVKQTELLRALESGKVPAGIWTAFSSCSFFDLVLTHTMQGFYGSPRHGGNKDYMSYRMLGLDYPRVMGQNRYRNS